jgi:ABC-2 type transport system permease protein
MQGLGEEKESRILESLMALVTPDELMFGKMIGLGAAGLGLVTVWGTLASLALLLHPLPVAIGPGTVLLAAYYFLVGYFFFGSFMLAVGSLVSTFQEANQWTALISLTALSPFFLLSTILDQPNGAIAVAVSLFPWTAPVSMMLRLPSGAVPTWQVVLSMALLLAAALFMLRLAARIFRVGLLLYGKTPNLPEILRWSKGA